MVRKSAGAVASGMANIATSGKPTEKTGVPQPSFAHRKGVMEGIVRGVPARTHTPMMDGLVKSACSHLGKAEDGMHTVKPSATKFATQEFGGVPYADARLGK